MQKKLLLKNYLKKRRERGKRVIKPNFNINKVFNELVCACIKQDEAEKSRDLVQELNSIDEVEMKALGDS